MKNKKSPKQSSTPAGNKLRRLISGVDLLQEATGNLGGFGEDFRKSFVLTGNLQEGKAGIAAFNGVIRGLHEERLCKEFEKKYGESAFFE